MSGPTPCRITDGPQTPEDMPRVRERDEDQEYESRRQRDMDENNPDLFDEDYQDATEHQRELDEQAMQGMEEWRLQTLYRKYTGHGLTITNDMRERAK